MNLQRTPNINILQEKRRDGLPPSFVHSLSKLLVLLVVVETGNDYQQNDDDDDCTGNRISGMIDLLIIVRRIVSGVDAFLVILSLVGVVRIVLDAQRQHRERQHMRFANAMQYFDFKPNPPFQGV